MKMNLQNYVPFKVMTALVVSAALITGCSKDDNDGPEPPKQTSALAWFHAAPASDSLHIFIDDQPAVKGAIGYGDSVKYAEVLAGERAVEIQDKDETSLLEDTLDLENNTAYSLFVIPGSEDGTAGLVQIKDEVSAPKEGNAKIRLVHVSPLAEALQVTSADTVLIDETDFKNASAFEEIEAGTNSFSIVDAESEAALLAIEDLELSAGKVYTLWVSGQPDASDPEQALQAHIFVHN